jgi:hypothetical protein
MTTDLKPYGYPTGVPIGSQVTVTIGRNVGTEPMDDADWETFAIATQYAVSEEVEPTATYGAFVGNGGWEDTPEESAVLIFIAGRHASIATLDRALAQVADAFDQDAIAWSFGPNHLARPACLRSVTS